MSDAGRPSEHVRYVGTELADVSHHHGLLRLAVGASHYQVLRANHSRFELADGYGWTYNHAPMLAYWHGRFYLQYLSNPSGEHVPPGHTLVVTSEDGVAWGFPREIFPIYPIPPGVHRPPDVRRLAESAYAVMHQRMGFYTAPDGRLLTLGFYGICSTITDYPNTGHGIGRVVREIYRDGSFGPIHFIRYNRHAGWSEENTAFPFYRESGDAGFVAACDALLADRLATLAWWEEDRSNDGFYAIAGGKALSWYRLEDGRVVGLWKDSLTAISADEGATWAPLRREPSLIMAAAKIWGQRTTDGRYALLYNPTPDNVHRWPLAIVTSDDGLAYDGMLVVNGKMPPRRYQGGLKSPGVSYVRGIPEGDGAPPGDALWVAYSMNKEDIWVTRVPVPVRSRVDEPADDRFARFETGSLVPGWNLHCGTWARVAVVDRPDGRRCLRLIDEDPADTAQAERVLPEARRMLVEFAVIAGQQTRASLYVEIADARGLAAAIVIVDDDGWIKVRSHANLRALCPYRAGETLHCRVSLDAVDQRYAVVVNDDARADGLSLLRPVGSLQRVLFRTGPLPDDPSLSVGSVRAPGVVELPFTAIPGSDVPAEAATFDLEYLRSRSGGR